MNTKHKAHVMTYYSIIKNLLKSTLFRDERKQWRERKSSLSSGDALHALLLYDTGQKWRSNCTGAKLSTSSDLQAAAEQTESFGRLRSACRWCWWWHLAPGPAAASWAGWLTPNNARYILKYYRDFTRQKLILACSGVATGRTCPPKSGLALQTGPG